MSGYRTEDLAHEAAQAIAQTARRTDPTLVLMGWAVIDDPRGGFAANVAFYRRLKGKPSINVTIKALCPEPRTGDMIAVVEAELSA